MNNIKAKIDFSFIGLFAFVLSLTCTHVNAWVGEPANAIEIFNADFYGSTINKVRYPSGDWSGSISGGKWTAGIPNTLSGTSNAFNYLVSHPTLSDYVENYIGTDTVPWSATPQPVQVMKVKQDDPQKGAISRIQYNWFPDSSVKDVYIKSYVKLQDNLLQVMPDKGVYMWRNLMEFREKEAAGSTQSIRAELGISRISTQGNSRIGWLGNVSYLPSYASVPNGYSFNTSVPIPQGKWFLLTVHYKLHPTEGAFEAAIQVCKDGGGFEGDQKELFSFKNIKTTAGNTNIGLINFMKVYAATEVLENGPIWQHIQNARIWVVF